MDIADIPASACLKVVHVNHPDHGLSDDEIQDRYEYIRCYIRKEFELLLMIPTPENDGDLFIGDYTVEDPEYSAFNSMDYQRTVRPFDKFGYAMNKIMERVKDLAVIHSCSSDDEGAKKVRKRYEYLVESRLRQVICCLAVKYQDANELTRFKIKRQIGELNCRILEARKIWEQFAPRDS